jgi:hypothetical protein
LSVTPSEEGAIRLFGSLLKTSQKKNPIVRKYYDETFKIEKNGSKMAPGSGCAFKPLVSLTLLISVSMNTNTMEAMGGNGALGRRRRKKRANDLWWRRHKTFTVVIYKCLS